MGFIQHHLGDNAGAVRCFRAALDLFASVSSLYKSADTAEHLADAYQALGDPVKARAALRDTLAILDKLGHPHAIELGGKLHALDRRTRPAAYRASTSCSSSGTR